MLIHADGPAPAERRLPFRQIAGSLFALLALWEIHYFFYPFYWRATPAPMIAADAGFVAALLLTALALLFERSLMPDAVGPALLAALSLVPLVAAAGESGVSGEVRALNLIALALSFLSFAALLAMLVRPEGRPARLWFLPAALCLLARLIYLWLILKEGFPSYSVFGFGTYYVLWPIALLAAGRGVREA